MSDVSNVIYSIKQHQDLKVCFADKYFSLDDEWFTFSWLVSVVPAWTRPCSRMQGRQRKLTVSHTKEMATWVHFSVLAIVELETKVAEDYAKF